MKALRIISTALFLFLAAGLFTPGLVRAQDDSAGDATPSFDYFYNALQDQGQWVQVEGYGYCWLPDVAANNPDWQPYTDGYWAYTDAGWTWVSYEDFGWITYHYGRWAQVEDLGWVWVPDYEWAPAWVSWRTTNEEGEGAGDGYIGWAPLPPEARFQADIGFSIWVDTDYDIGPRYYNFCRVRDFGAPVLGPVIIDRRRNITIINQTVNITNITVNNNIVFNGGPGYRFVSHHAAHPVPTLHLVRETNPGFFHQQGPKGMLAQAKGNQLFVAAPLISPPKHAFKPEKVARTIDKPVFNKGWKGVDPKQKLQVEDSFKTQTKGVKPHQPAKPVTEQQLAVIPKGNPSATPGPTGSPGPGRPPFPGRSPRGGATPLPGTSPSPALATPVPGGASPVTTPGGRPGRSPKPGFTPKTSFTPPSGGPASTTPEPTPGGGVSPVTTPGGRPGRSPRPGFSPKTNITPFNPGGGPALTTPQPTPAGEAPPATPGGKPLRTPRFTTPVPGGNPAPTGHARPEFTPVIPSVTATPPPKFNTPPPKFNTPPPKLATPAPQFTTPVPKFNTPPPRLNTPPPQPQHTPPPFVPRPAAPPQTPPPAMHPVQPQPPVHPVQPGTGFPGKKGSPTPTPAVPR